MMSVLPTSFSALNSFETCPLKHYLTRISKEVTEPIGEAIIWGNTVHKGLENYLRKNEPLNKSLKQYQHYADKIRDAHPAAKLLVEQKLAVDEDFQPTGWWDKDAWFRGIIDVAILYPEKAYVFDWKTGKQKDDFDQLQMFAALLTACHPTLEEIHSAFIWLQPKTLTRQSYSNEAARKFWARLVPRVARLEHAMATNKWPAKPSGLCRNWCSVGRHRCVHCGS